MHERTALKVCLRCLHCTRMLCCIRTPTSVLLVQAYKDTLIITIKGIAAGMQNTG